MNESKYGPACEKQSDVYPKKWEGKVPSVVCALKTVTPDIPGLCGGNLVCHRGENYSTWVNSHGAVSAVLADGRLGLRPDEFEVVEFFDPGEIPRGFKTHWTKIK